MYSVGDVVLVPVPYGEMEGFKVRPAIVIKHNPSLNKYLVVEINSLKDKHYSMSGRRIISGSDEYKKMGIKEDSFINAGSRAWVEENKILRKSPLGTYPFMDEFQ